MTFHPDGHLLASGSNDHPVRLWDRETGDCISIVKAHEDRLRCVTFSPAGDAILSGSDDSTIKLWDAQTFANTGTRRGERPYEQMNIAHAQGLTDAQRAALRTLGALEEEPG